MLKKKPYIRLDFLYGCAPDAVLWYNLFKCSNELFEMSAVMDLAKAIKELAVNFEACHKTLSAMGDETRQHIILEMMRMDYHGSRVPDITEKTNLSRPAVSHHLQILKDAGIVKMRKEGTMTYYYLDPDMESFTRLSDALLQAVRICENLPDRSGRE